MTVAEIHQKSKRSILDPKRRKDRSATIFDVRFQALVTPRGRVVAKDDLFRLEQRLENRSDDPTAVLHRQSQRLDHQALLVLVHHQPRQGVRVGPHQTPQDIGRTARDGGKDGVVQKRPIQGDVFFGVAAPDDLGAPVVDASAQGSTPRVPEEHAIAVQRRREPLSGLAGIDPRMAGFDAGMTPRPQTQLVHEYLSG